MAGGTVRADNIQSLLN